MTTTLCLDSFTLTAPTSNIINMALVASLLLQEESCLPASCLLDSLLSHKEADNMKTNASNAPSTLTFYLPQRKTKDSADMWEGNRVNC